MLAQIAAGISARMVVLGLSFPPKLAGHSLLCGDKVARESMRFVSSQTWLQIPT